MEKKLTKTIPHHPGVYIFKDALGTVLYIGKAKELHKRVSSYFQKYKTDWKIKALIDEQVDVEYILTKNELEALLLEAQLVKQYQPKYNVLLKSGQPFYYILFTTETPEKMELVRNKKKRGSYIGPFLHKTAARRVYHFLLRQFKLNLCNKTIENGCLDYHIGNCAGSCMSGFDQQEYEFRLQLAHEALKHNHKKFIEKITHKIQEYNQELAFEKARNLKGYLDNLTVIFDTIKTGFKESKYISDAADATTPKSYVAQFSDDIAIKLQQFLGTEKPVVTIDCFDISHFQSQALVGSCVRFTNGIPTKDKFRRFAIRTLHTQNDYAALQEVVLRRYKDRLELPDVILIDGGKGQLSAVKHVMPEAYCVSLAKKEERLFTPVYADGIPLDIHSEHGTLFIALRDYAHHFAITYHRLKRSKGSYGSTT